MVLILVFDLKLESDNLFLRGGGHVTLFEISLFALRAFVKIFKFNKFGFFFVA